MPKMTAEQRALVRAKKSIFRELCIPWSYKFEDDFVSDCAKYPSTDPVHILDRIVRDTVKDNDDKDGKYYYKLLCKHYAHADAVYEDNIIATCGMDGFEKMKRAKYIEYCGYLYGRRVYAI